MTRSGRTPNLAAPQPTGFPCKAPRESSQPGPHAKPVAPRDSADGARGGGERGAGHSAPAPASGRCPRQFTAGPLPRNFPQLKGPACPKVVTLP